MNESYEAGNLENNPNAIQKTAEERAEWARRFCESGLSLRKFSAQQGLKWYSLWRWVQSRQKTLNKANGGELVAQAVDFTEIKPPDFGNGNWVAEVSWPDGKVVRFSSEVSPSLLEQLLRVC